MKYKVRVESSNADVDTDQRKVVYFKSEDGKDLATIYQDRFMAGSFMITLYKNGIGYGKTFPHRKDKDRWSYDICVAHCAEEGYVEEAR